VSSDLVVLAHFECSPLAISTLRLDLELVNATLDRWQYQLVDGGDCQRMAELEQWHACGN
jgi:hypothetical protein